MCGGDAGAGPSSPCTLQGSLPHLTRGCHTPAPPCPTPAPLAPACTGVTHTLLLTCLVGWTCLSSQTWRRHFVPVTLPTVPQGGGTVRRRATFITPQRMARTMPATTPHRPHIFDYAFQAAPAATISPGACLSVPALLYLHYNSPTPVLVHVGTIGRRAHTALPGAGTFSATAPDNLWDHPCGRGDEWRAVWAETAALQRAL